jgi:AcrR family transcriptional regulator
MPRAKRREREIQRTREDILDAAARVFARVGYLGATMQEIAREAGYTAPSLYTYFEGKEALLRELYERFLNEVLEVFDRPIPKGLTLEQSLELLLNAALEHCDRHSEALVAFASVTSAGPLPANLRPTDKAVNGQLVIIERAANWLADNAKPEELGAVSCEEAAYVIFGITNAMIMLWQSQGRRDPLVSLAPRALSFFMRGLREMTDD